MAGVGPRRHHDRPGNDLQHSRASSRSLDAASSPMILRRVSALVFAAALCSVVSAHIGSPNVLFDGTAGPYALRVIVRPPEVVPGLAEVTVRVDAPDVEHVVIRPV